MAASSSIPLTDLSIPQIDKVLGKLQLFAPDEYDADDRLGILLCSQIYRRYLSGYDFDSVLACFNSRGNFIDFKTNDDEVDGIFPKKADKNVVLYPCGICSKEVTDEENNTGYGLHCSGCEGFFHNSCNDHPVTIELFNQLKNSPSYVKTFCRNCNVAMNDVTQRLRVLDRKVREVKAGIDTVKENASLNGSMSYSAKLQQNIEQSAASKLTSSITKKLAAQQKVLNAEETEDRNKRTLLVRKPLDVSITNSKSLRSSFNKEFPGIVIKNCRITAGGSFKIELDKEEEAKKVSDEWKMDSFGGNQGVTSPLEMHTSGIIKHIYTDNSEEDIINELTERYTSIKKVELFKKDNNFSGIVKVIFNSRKDLLESMEERIKIFNQRYIMEEYKPLPRVIKCNKCQAFGHIARRCRAEKPNCGKCCEDSHETLQCTSTVKKCAHCNENHETGDKTCKIMKSKLDEIRQRAQYGF